MKRVLVIVPFPFGEQGLANRAAQSAGISDKIEFVYRGVKAGPTLFDSNHDLLVADVSIFEAGMRAQEEGFDAVCIDTVSDSGLWALRSVLDIPVIGPGKASFALALTLGDKFSVVSMWAPWELAVRKGLKDSGLEAKCASVRSLTDFTPDVENLLAGKEEEFYPKLLRLAEQCVEEDGAHVILMASTTMHQAHAYLAERLPVPVLNPGPVSYQLAESVLSLGLTHSRAAYRKGTLDKPDLFSAMLDAGHAHERSVGRITDGA
ncbi:MULTISPECIES: aspartate/glutamate racemase family protein [Aeromicrobium]|uniref:aspartate/glutamate racemase family protein n=1 Tax=Aeromicrobium TaxID=2040 RepID=UPI001892C8A7|nr:MULTISPECIES: aspartate/glutamate racemase family protein [Aeromicrobium]